MTPATAPPPNLDAAFAAHQAGHLHQAERLYLEALTASPGHPEVLHHLGLLRHQQGRSEEGLQLIRRAVDGAPRELRYRFNFAVVLAALGRGAEADAQYAEAARLDARGAAEWVRQGEAELARGKPTEAVHCARMALAREDAEADASALALLGAAELVRKRPAAAERAFRHALQAGPDSTAARVGLGRALIAMGRSAEGREQIAQAARRDPLHPEPALAQVEALLEAHAFAEVIQRLEPVVSAHPEHVEARFRMAGAQVRLGQLAPAERHLRQALTLAPQDARLHNDLASVLLGLRRLDEARAEAEAAARLHPELAEAYANLGTHAVLSGNMDLAERQFLQGLVRAPDNGDIRNNYANALLRLCRVEEAQAEYREVLRRDPGHIQAHSNLLLTLNYRDPPSLGTMLEEHRAYWRRHGASVARPAGYANTPHPERRLRIGFVGGHITTTPVHVFMRPYFEHYDRARFEVHCYDTDAPDERVQSIKRLTDQWHDLAGQPLRDTAERIRQDGIDILVDLMGHMGETRILLFAAKPAPVQASYMGYLNTTGLETMDYWITDAEQNPAGTEAWFAEELVRLPRCFVCYAPSADAPPVAPLPMLTRGAPAFGCYNNLAKLSPRAVRAFAQVLRAVPGSMLVCKALHAGVASVQARIRERFAAQGVAPERIEFRAPGPHRDYLADFAQIDVALDPFPYNGNTSTNDALYMGVPVVTLAGDNAISRTGVSLLTHLGRPEWIARGEEDYARIAAGLVTDPARLAGLRAGLRAEMEASPLMDGPGFARAMDDAFRGLWRRWCASRR